MTLDMSDELKGKISFLGFMEGLASWAREAWRRNPQLAEYFNTDRLAYAAWMLEEYDRDEAVRKLTVQERRASLSSTEREMNPKSFL